MAVKVCPDGWASSSWALNEEAGWDSAQVSQGYRGGQALSGHLGAYLFKKGFQPQMDRCGDHYRGFLAGQKAGSLTVSSHLKGTRRVFILDVDQTRLKVLARMLDQFASGKCFWWSTAKVDYLLCRESAVKAVPLDTAKWWKVSALMAFWWCEPTGPSKRWLAVGRLQPSVKQLYLFSVLKLLESVFSGVETTFCLR